jgi:hypothetical protein
MPGNQTSLGRSEKDHDQTLPGKLPVERDTLYNELRGC